MIQFKTIKEALKYKDKCPLCSYNLEMSHLYGDMDYDNNRLHIFNYSNIIIIDILNDSIKVIPNEDMSTPFMGLHVTRLMMSCHSCKNYECYLLLKINLQDFCWEEISFNSETIIVGSDRIKNIFSINETQYHKNIYGTMTGLPLIPFDFSNPQNTIDKIKLLIPYI
jgi:hypothetical protein